jgi:hypothetical protein
MKINNDILNRELLQLKININEYYSKEIIYLVREKFKYLINE